MPSKELYIGNIHPDTKSHEIREIFEKYGNVNRCEFKYGGSGKIERFIFI
jgi:RNA recognition motif-containing protein